MIVIQERPLKRQEEYDDAKAFTPDAYAPYYITAAWANENVTRVPFTYVVGNGSVSYANGVRYLNAGLRTGSDYTFFVWIDLMSDTVSCVVFVFMSRCIHHFRESPSGFVPTSLTFLQEVQLCK